MKRMAVVALLVALGAAARAQVCGDGMVDSPEECDPPGSVTCPPGSPAGAFLVCLGDCTCPPLPTTTTTTSAPSTTVTTSTLNGTTSTSVTTTVAPTTSTTSTTVAPCGNDLDACLDDFTCYRSRTTPGTPRFAGVASVSLVDQFETATARVVKDQELCTPTDKDGEGIVDPITHLLAYSIKGQSPKHVKRTAIRITNQLGEIRVSTVKPELLLVPTAKNLSTPPAPPNPTATNVDHYKCYRVRVTPGTPKFASGTLVQASDQFEAPRLLSLKKVRHLCTPVDKNGEGIKNPQAHLFCYVAKPAVGQPHHTRVSGIFVNNQFGPLNVDTLREGEFCIPSHKSFSPSGAFLEEEAGDVLE
jgi:hypothetical protein